MHFTKRVLDLTGKRFGNLVVIEHIGSHPRNKQAMWNCRCGCGKTTVVVASSLTRNNTKSCGCRHRKHGMFGTPTYSSWCAMIARCCRKTAADYQNYGGRGITVCDRWRDFRNFLADMGERPSMSHTIGREQNDGNYTPENCRWETDSQQRNNKRSSHFLTWNNETHTIAEWERIRGFSENVLPMRLKAGWSVERALATPVRRKPIKIVS